MSLELIDDSLVGKEFDLSYVDNYIRIQRKTE